MRIVEMIACFYSLIAAFFCLLKMAESMPLGDLSVTTRWFVGAELFNLVFTGLADLLLK